MMNRVKMSPVVKPFLPAFKVFQHVRIMMKAVIGFSMALFLNGLARVIFP